MLKLIVLITLISGISTRGVPKADDNAELGPKGIETDQKDHSSEHDNLTECEDCIKSSEDDDGEDDIFLERKNEGGDIGNDGLDVLKATPKRKRTRRIKSFLTFHRINVNVNRDRHVRRKISSERKEKPENTSKGTNTQIKEEKDQIDNDNGQTETPLENNGHRRKSKSKATADSKHSSKVKNAHLRNSQRTANTGEEPKESHSKTKSNSKHKAKETERGNTVKIQIADTEPSKTKATYETKVKTHKEITNSKTTTVSIENKENVKPESTPDSKTAKGAVDTRIETTARLNKPKTNAVQTDLHENILLAETSGLSGNDKVSKNILKSAKYAKAGNEFKEKVSKSTVDHILEDKVDKSVKSEEKVSTKNVKSETFNSEPKASSKDKKEEKETIYNARSTKKPKQDKNTKPKPSIVDKSEDSEKKSTEKPKDEKDTVDRIIPKNSRDRWSRKGLSQVPDVERLERRLHPTVDAPVSDIIRSMKNMLRLIQSSLYRVDSDFMMIQNTTRWKYMVGVRNQLTELSEENDEIYDVVMESSLLTKQIYRQAHERKHPRSDIEAVAVSYRSRLNTNMHPQIRKNFHEAQRELEIAKRLIEQIKGIRNKKDSLIDEEMRLHHLVRDNLPMRSMHDLYRRADQTIRVLSAAQPLSRYGDKSRLYGHMRNDTDLNMKRARELTVEGFDLLTHAKRVLLENRQKVQEHGRMMRHRLPAGTVSDMPFDSGRMDLFVAWDEANHHANSLSETAAEIHMKFDPLIKKAKEVIENSAGVGFKKQFEQSIAEMKETVKGFLKTLDNIRVVIGDERILQERCEDIQSSGLFLDVKGSPINCDPYLQETVQGSGDGIDGSGDDDDTFVDTELTKLNKTDVVDEKASVNVDKPEESFIDIDSTPPKESAIDTDITNPDESSVDVDITKPKEKSVDVDITTPKESTVIKDKDKTNPTASSVDIGVTKPNKTDQIDKTNTLKPATVSKIDGTDDEDIAHELKVKMTQKTTTTPATTTEVTTESATEGSDEDFVFDPFGWFNDEPDEESILLGTEDDLTGLMAVPSNMTLNEHIRERLYNYSQGSKRILESARTNASKMEEISLTWKKVQDRFSTLRNKTMNGIATISKWKAERAYFQAVHIRVKGVSDDIILKKEVIEEQCSSAVEAANKKLKDMTKVYEKQSEKAKNAADPTDVNEAVTQVKVVLDNVKEIDRLKQLYPTPCGTLERLDRKIRTNITELRKKIEKAKLIASSLQIAVSVPKKGYLEFPISDIPLESHPLTSQAQMMLKHTGSDGRLLSMHAGESESISLDVKTDGLTVVQSIDGDESSHTLYADKIENQWYLIQLQRYAASYNVTMIGENGVLGKVGLPNSLDGQRPFTQDLLPTSLSVGASGEDLSACALGIEINGRSVNMFDMSYNKAYPTPCSSQGRWTSNQPQLLLDGSGYAAISFDDIRLGRTLQSIKVSFKPRSDGTVIFLQPERMATVIDVYVEKGLLVVFVHYRGFETKLKSTVEVYGNNQILEISFKSGRTKGANVVLNGKSNVFKSAKGGKRGKQSSSKHIFIGGFRGGNSSSSMVGCIKSLEVNGEEIPFHNIHEAEGHSYGSCRETECIMFDDNSIPIELTNLTLVQAVHVSVRRGSLGPVIQYSKHKEKFNLEISVNTEGVHVEETVKENDEDLSLNRDSEFIVITIQDDTEDKSVTVTVDGESEEFSYGNGGGWGGGWGGNGNKDDEGPVSYSISMATSSEDSPQFIGSIQNLILDGRPVDLIRYVESNQLGRCTVDPAPRKTTIPDTASKGITCQ